MGEGGARALEGVVICSVLLEGVVVCSVLLDRGVYNLDSTDVVDLLGLVLGTFAGGARFSSTNESSLLTLAAKLASCHGCTS
jgi:hypothetical protein